MPIFEGWNPDGWIFKVERFFSAHRMIEEKMEVVAISLDGETLAWFQWEESWRLIMNWGELKTRLLGRFRKPRRAPYVSNFCRYDRRGRFGTTSVPSRVWWQQ